MVPVALLFVMLQALVENDPQYAISRVVPRRINITVARPRVDLYRTWPGRSTGGGFLKAGVEPATEAVRPRTGCKLRSHTSGLCRREPIAFGPSVPLRLRSNTN